MKRKSLLRLRRCLMCAGRFPWMIFIINGKTEMPAFADGSMKKDIALVLTICAFWNEMRFSHNR